MNGSANWRMRPRKSGGGVEWTCPETRFVDVEGSGTNRGSTKFPPNWTYSYRSLEQPRPDVVSLAAQEMEVQRVLDSDSSKRITLNSMCHTRLQYPRPLRRDRIMIFSPSRDLSNIRVTLDESDHRI